MFLIFIVWLLCFSSVAMANEDAARPMRVRLRHIEAGGIGYKHGYTTIKGFFAWDKKSWVPFLDLRGHVFNTGKFAANAGIGLRYAGLCRIWGINAYYDYRNTSRFHYNQMAAGLESLGKIWDFRINGYLPVGKKRSPFWGTRFDRFKGHHLLLSKKQEVAFKGANAEIGAHVDKVKNIPFYFAGGPYYLNGGKKTTWGGSARVTVDFFSCLKLEGNVSYDHLFKWIGQGAASLSWAFGGKKKSTGCDKIFVRQRTFQEIDRMEIIPVDQQRKNFVAINPATGLPYEFIFVDNTSHSKGTFESPFPTLLEAQFHSSPRDIIYVLPGDGTSKGMDNGILLQDLQQLLGSGQGHSLLTTFGLIPIPALTSRMPILTNTRGNVITIANHNVISGFQINNEAAAGILGVSVADVLLQDNAFIANLSYPSVTLTDVEGQLSIDHNAFTIRANSTGSLPNSDAISIHQSHVATVSITNNSFVNQGRVGSTFVDLLDTGGKIWIADNSFVTQGSPVMSLPNDNGIAIDNLNISASITITNNSLVNQGGFGALIIMDGNANHTITVKGNKLVTPPEFETMQEFYPGSTPTAFRFLGLGSSTAHIHVTDNQCLDQGISFATRDEAQISFVKE